MLKRNLKAKVAKPIFFDEYNEIDVYIEDTAVGYKKLFTKIVQRVLEPHYKVDSVFPLGGRTEVIAACKTDQGKKNRARIYIVDGDLYLLSGETEDLNLRGLYVLPRYCIENHLLCDLSLLSIMDEEDPTRSFDVLAGLLDFDGWVDANKNHLVELFIEYGVAKKIAPTVQTVAFGYRGLVSSNDGLVDPVKVDMRIKDVKEQVIKISGQDLYDKTRQEISQNISFDKNHLLSLVSGKDLLMPLLLMRCKSIVDLKLKSIALKFRIANVCNLESVESLPTHINTL